MVSPSITEATPLSLSAPNIEVGTITTVSARRKERRLFICHVRGHGEKRGFPNALGSESGTLSLYQIARATHNTRPPSGLHRLSGRTCLSISRLPQPGLVACSITPPNAPTWL